MTHDDSTAQEFTQHPTLPLQAWTPAPIIQGVPSVVLPAMSP
jgi:hypothetical protein